MTAQTFMLPDLGEGLTESEILNWKIKVGEHVALNQIIAEVETAKAVVELPSPFAGIVQTLHVSEGQVVPVGGALVTFAGQSPDEESTVVASSADTSVQSNERTATLVGYGAPATTGQRPARRLRGAGAKILSTPPAPGEKPTDKPQSPYSVARSTPPVRKLARDLGIDISTVTGTGLDGLVLRADVERANHTQSPRDNDSGGAGSIAGDRHVKISATRRATAKAMVQSAFTAPHAAEFLTVDLTNSLELIDRLRSRKEFQEMKLNITSLTALVISRLLLRFPALNSHWDEENGQIIEFGSVNLGIAVASDRGLLVPVLQGAQNKSLEPLTAELNQLISRGRAGDLTPAQLSGGTFTLTNVGIFGVDAGIPILLPGQTGILALGQVKPRPWGVQGQVVLRQTATLTLSFDHRVVDGREASGFLAGVGAVLEDPGMINFFL